MTQKQSKANQSVEKVLQIIEIMAENREAMRLQQIAQQSNLPASTALRLVNTLLIHGYVVQNPSNLRYSLSMKFLHIGGLVGSRFNIRDFIRTYLEELSEKCQESSCLAIEEDMQTVYIDVVDGPDTILKTTQRIGKRAPMHCTGVGKLFLTNFSDEDLVKYADLFGLPSFTTYTIDTKEKLIEEIHKVAAQGYATDDQECELGAKCIAAPIINSSGKIIAAISITGPAYRMTTEKIVSIMPVLTNIAKTISDQLAYAML